MAVPDTSSLELIERFLRTALKQFSHYPQVQLLQLFIYFLVSVLPAEA